jgi:ribose transport system ATP-binding protein
LDVRSEIRVQESHRSDANNLPAEVLSGGFFGAAVIDSATQDIADAERAPALRLRSMGKSFPGVQALSDVSLSVGRGEVRALLGENGAGKSTLMNILSGAFAQYDGEIEIDGRPVTIRSPRSARDLGIAMIHQELHLVPELSVADNFFLGRERRTWWGKLDRSSMHRETARYLAELDLALSPNRPVGLAKVAEAQLIEVAKALSLDARILIMDEPTSALAEAEVQQLFAVIRRLSERGVCVIYISHRLEELPQIAHSVSVLRDGRMIGTLPIAQATRGDLIAMMVGRPLQAFFPSQETRAGQRELLRAERLDLSADVRSGRRSLKDISFTLHTGEIVGIAGLMGAGRTEVLETLFGVHPARSVRGRLYLDGRPVRLRSPRQAIARGLAFVTEDRKAQSLITSLSVRFNITLAALRRLMRGVTIDRARERAAAGDAIRDLRIKTPSAQAIVNDLSGGNQQKVVIAKCLLTQPRILLMDEPTRGIDVGAKAEIYALMKRLVADGLGIVMVSSELPELLALCDRIFVLCEGRITGEFARGTATQEQLLEAATRREAVIAHAV